LAHRASAVKYPHACAGHPSIIPEASPCRAYLSAYYTVSSHITHPDLHIAHRSHDTARRQSHVLSQSTQQRPPQLTVPTSYPPTTHIAQAHAECIHAPSGGQMAAARRPLACARPHAHTHALSFSPSPAALPRLLRTVGWHVLSANAQRACPTAAPASHATGLWPRFGGALRLAALGGASTRPLRGLAPGAPLGRRRLARLPIG
jgi:hypothetical protein